MKYLGSGLLFLFLVTPKALAEPFKHPSVEENHCLPTNSPSVRQNPLLENFQINPPSIPLCEAAESVAPITLPKEKKIVTASPVSVSSVSLNALSHQDAEVTEKKTNICSSPSVQGSVHKLHSCFNSLDSSTGYPSPSQEVAPVRADEMITPPVVTPNFSRDVENLSPCRREALNSPPWVKKRLRPLPSPLVGENERGGNCAGGLGLGLVFPHDVKSQVVTQTPLVAQQVSPTQPNQDSAEMSEAFSADEAMTQVTSVSQLSDVQPTDWAFQVLRSLVERYGCIAGYPDSSFRGNQTLTRYEFAAGLNACLERIGKLSLSQEDSLTLQKLQEEFATELVNLRGRVDALEARTNEVEAKQFSPTVFFGGQVILGLATAAGGNPPGRGENNTVLNYLSQLQIASSFTGKDVLRVGLATGNFDNRGFANPNSLNTNMSLLSYQTDLDNQIQLNSLEYRFTGFGDRVVFTLKPVGFRLDTVLSPNSTYSDAGQGAISRFAEVNPVFRIGNLDAGIGLDWLVSDKVRLQFAYGTRNGTNGAKGLFESDHNALGVQLLLNPTPSLILGLAYVNGYSRNGQLDTFTGSNNSDISGGFNEPARIHALSATLRWRLASNLTFGAWGGVILTDATFGAFVDAILTRSIDLDKLNALTLTTTYLFSLGISDPFGRKGDLLAFLVGQPPKLNAGILIERVDEGTSLHFESFYRFKLNDNVSVTPGFFIVTDPGHISRNNNIFVGTIRTTLSF
jgi:hypothetical protein